MSEAGIICSITGFPWSHRSQPKTPPGPRHCCASSNCSDLIAGELLAAAATTRDAGAAARYRLLGNWFNSLASSSFSSSSSILVSVEISPRPDLLERSASPDCESGLQPGGNFILGLTSKFQCHNFLSVQTLNSQPSTLNCFDPPDVIPSPISEPFLP